MKCFVTGGAGFIGSNMVDKLLQRGDEVVAYDNFSTGQKEFLSTAQNQSNFKLIVGDTLDTHTLKKSMAGSEIVFHFAANADVRHGPENTSRDLEQNTLATLNVLDAMKENNIKHIVFSSTGSVYGEANIIPTPENAPFPIQTSLYGASKLACEGLITAFCESFGFTCHIFRFVSVLGQRYSHGHVFDFYKKLLKNSDKLQVLGNGHQKKSYIHINDCINGILLTIDNPTESVNIYNLGTDDYCEVNDSINWITSYMTLSPKISYGGGDRGWPGDNPFIFLDCSKIRSLGWSPVHTIEEGVISTLDYLSSNKWLLEYR